MINLPLQSHLKKNSEEKFIEIQRLAFSKLNRFYNNKNINYETLFNFEKFARWFVILHSWNVSMEQLIIISNYISIQ